MTESTILSIVLCLSRRVFYILWFESEFFYLLLCIKVENTTMSYFFLLEIYFQMLLSTSFPITFSFLFLYNFCQNNSIHNNCYNWQNNWGNKNNSVARHNIRRMIVIARATIDNKAIINIQKNVTAKVW